MKLTPLTLSIVTTTLISGVAIALAWTGPTGSPFGNNTAAPINAGGVDQTKSGGLGSNGFVSGGGVKVGLSTMLGSISLTPRNVLEVNGNITNTAALNANVNLAGYNLGVGTIGAQTIYGYGSVCTGNTAATCTGTGGVVVGGSNTSANVNITNTGNSFFNVGNFGIGTNSPTAELDVFSSASDAKVALFGYKNDFPLMITNGNTTLSTAGTLKSRIGLYYTDNLANESAAIHFLRGGGALDGRMFFRTNNTNRVLINEIGNVGIGTTTPSQKLSVAGAIYSSSGGYIFPDGTTQTTAATGQWTTSGANIYNSNSGVVTVGGISTSPEIKFEVKEGVQSLGFLTNRALTGTWPPVAQPTTMTIQSSGSSAGNLAFATGNNERMRIASNGNVGIGTTNPTSKLQVTGNTIFESTAGTSYFSSGASNYIRGNTYFNGTLIDENNSAYYLNPEGLNSLNNLTLGGTLGVTGVTTLGTLNSTTINNSGLVTATGFSNIGTGNTRVYQNVYNYKLSGNSTGTMKIVMPKGRTNTMLRITINGYNYSGSTGAWQATIGGYTYGTTQPWVNTSQEITGRAPFSSIRLAYEGSTAVILLGDTSTAWANPSINISEVMATHVGQNDWETGWVASITTDESAITAPITPPTSVNQSYIANQNASAQTANAWISGAFTANGTVTGSGGVLANGPGGGSWLQYSNGNNYLRGNTYLGGILYDENNSAYYVDPASTSNLNALNVASGLNFGTVRSGAVGVYDPANTQSIWAMGASYKLPAGGASNNYGNFYGIAKSYNPDHGGTGNNPQSKSGLEHQYLFMSAGVTRTAIGNGIWSNGVIHSASGGFRFPDGTTQTTASTGLTGAVLDGVAGDWEIANGGAFSQYASAAIEIREANFAGAGTGVAAEAPRISFHWSGRVASQIGMDSGGRIRTYDNPGTGYENFAAANIEAVNGTVTGTTITTGAGSHLSYSGTTNYLRGNTYANGVYYDENNTAYYIDPASTSITNDLRANIFYDQGNTGYYVDPASTSNLNSLYTQSLYTTGGISDAAGVRMDSAGGWFRTYGQSGWYNGTYGGGLYMVDTTWIRTYGGKSFYHNTGAFRTDGTLQVGSGGSTLSVPNGGNTAVGYGLTVATTGTFGGNVTAPAFVYSSDRSLKENIQPLQNSLDKVRSLDGYEFTWKKDGRADVGVIAQEVESIFPTLVHTDHVTGLKSVEYANLVAPLIEAVKELANSLDALATRVFNTEVRQTELEKQNAVQAQQIADLQRQINLLQAK